MRASSSLMRCCSSGSVEALSWSANSKNRRFSASFDSSPVSISSTRTRFALVRWIFAKALTRLARREGSEICSDGQLFQWSSWLNCTLSCTTLHQSAKAARSTQTTSGGGGRILLAATTRPASAAPTPLPIEWNAGTSSSRGAAFTTISTTRLSPGTRTGRLFIPPASQAAARRCAASYLLSVFFASFAS